MDTCKTCKHWELKDYTNTEAAFGKCNNIKLLDEITLSDSIFSHVNCSNPELGNEIKDYFVSIVKTRKEFGCNNWKYKHPECCDNCEYGWGFGSHSTHCRKHAPIKNIENNSSFPESMGWCGDFKFKEGL
jgi:hypothetical protein